MANDLNAPVDTVAVSALVTATPLLAAGADTRRFKGVFINPTNGEIALGGEDVTAASGILVGAGEKLFLEWTAGTRWHAIRTGGSNVDVRVLPVR